MHNSCSNHWINIHRHKEWQNISSQKISVLVSKHSSWHYLKTLLQFCRIFLLLHDHRSLATRHLPQILYPRYRSLLAGCLVFVAIRMMRVVDSWDQFFQMCLHHPSYADRRLFFAAWKISIPRTIKQAEKDQTDRTEVVALSVVLK